MRARGEPPAQDIVGPGGRTDRAAVVVKLGADHGRPRNPAVEGLQGTFQRIAEEVEATRPLPPSTTSVGPYRVSSVLSPSATARP